MKILCLYNNVCAEELFDWLQKQGHEVYLCREQLEDVWCARQEFDLTVSYTYRFILKESTIKALSSNVVNLHNSFLPWNRGADPNIWSIVDNTPRGVTLHYMDRELDKGYIIAQSFVPMDREKTLAENYYALDKAAKELFKEAFMYYDYWGSLKKKAVGSGNYHSVKDGERIKKYISSYEMKADELISVRASDKEQN